ncbi:MAG: type II secretion system F family protein [Methanocellales archaeon]|nr:type II secretion system F family protein [Methanocellales archaeon]
MVNVLQTFAYGILGDRLKSHREKYYGLRLDILKARMKTTFEMYLATTLVCAVLIGAVSTVITITIVYGFASLNIITASLSILVGIGFSMLTYLGFLIYPSLVAARRGRHIDATLPYAINYIAAMAGAKVIPADVFRSLARADIYGDIAVEARYIVRDIDLFGRDLNTAIKNIAATTPSLRLQEFLYGVITTSTSGGELEPYFRIKAEVYTSENRRAQKEFIETLGFIGEMYVAAFVAGPLLLIIMLSVILMLSGAPPTLLYLIAYLLIPLGALITIFATKMAAPSA